MLGELLHCLLCAAEKAANIARACRAEETLFKLLVEEKTGTDKNAKFAQDFKGTVRYLSCCSTCSQVSHVM